VAYPYVAKRLLAGDTAEMREKLLKLLLGQEGRSIRERLLLTLVRDDRLNTDDLRSLMELVGRTFAPRRIVERMGQRLGNRLLGRSNNPTNRTMAA
jgi:hypothetical protein